MLARAEVCHDSLVDLAGEEAFEASNDLTRGPAVRRAASHVFDGRLVEPHADEHGSIEGGVGPATGATRGPVRGVLGTGWRVRPRRRDRAPWARRWA